MDFFSPLYLLTGYCWFTGKLLIAIQPLCQTLFWTLFSELNLSVSIDSLGCSLERQSNQLQIMMIFVSFPIVIPHSFFTSYCVSYRPASNICLAWGKSTNGDPLTTCQGTMNWKTKRSQKANACYYWETIIVMEESIAIERGRTWQVDLSFLLLSTSAAQILPEH